MIMKKIKIENNPNKEIVTDNKDTTIQTTCSTSASTNELHSSPTGVNQV